jgi:predicted dienelactone hydrolase
MKHHHSPLRTCFSAVAAFALLLASVFTSTQAATGVTVLPPGVTDGPVTVFYPTAADAVPTKRGPFTVTIAANSTPERGNGRLIVISHGSGASAWVYNDLAQHLVAEGFIVAIPEHAGDNWHDHSKLGPPSWKLRPLEISRAIDAIAQDARFAPLVDVQRVGVWGMSAGGHTALALAGGRWSPAQLLRHCEAHLADDFALCTGAATSINGNGWDGIKKAVAMPLIRWHLRGDEAWYGHTDPRIQAIVAGVPVAADFDLATLATPLVPLGVIQAEQDIWLVPKFHSGPLIAACKTCEVLASLPAAGHGALLAPLPADNPPRIQRLLVDPPGFDRATLPALYGRTSSFFRKHLIANKPGHASTSTKAIE